MGSVALIAASALLVGSFSFYTITVRTIPENQELQNIINHLAAKGSELLTLVTVTNSTTRLFEYLPPRIGDQQYWVQLRNDSSNTWLEGALGQLEEREATIQVFLPRKISASGQYVGGHGSAILECYMNSSVLQLNLSSAGG
ncbi:MAG: hypothetical protein JSV85_00880 [Candidatus Bathyarchaeota archaeon]|nr:MAG: hypothetical protein JSV85_00880 [Candidatus Bathyarchaeota archaeon]